MNLELNMNNKTLSVQKRDGSYQEVSFDKVLKRIKVLSVDLDVNYTLVTQKICNRIYDKVKTSELDILGSEICANMITVHPDYQILAARIFGSNLDKNTSLSFSETIQIMWDNKDKNGNQCPLISEELYNIVKKHKTKINSVIKHKRDGYISYFGLKTLERSYLFRVDGQIVERPQYMFMRVALGIHGENIREAIRTYDGMSEKYFIHATPTLFNAGTKRPQLSSCFLLSMHSDSIDGIYSTLKNCANISKWAGGIGLHIHNVRAKDSVIRGTNGISNGIVPMLRNFNSTARYVDQGGGKRNGSIAIYLEPWHSDIESFLDLRKNHGNEEERARDLFYALWIPDLFMKRVKDNGQWTLMCPDECPGLADVYGDEFETLYTKYEQEGRGRRSINAQTLWNRVLQSQIETGTPYLLYKDACNEKSNQKNLGTIKSSNLCCEIVEYSSPEEAAVCNLSSIGLPRFISKDEEGKPYFDFDKLGEIVKQITKNLNRVIDINYYPIPETRTSNFRHRPIGIGVQGLADVFALLLMPFDSEEAKHLNRKIFEVIYYHAMECSMDIARKREKMIKKYKELVSKITSNSDLDNMQELIDEKTKMENDLKPIREELDREKYLGSYSSFEGSPASKGIFQYDMGIEPSEEMKPNGINLRKMLRNMD